MNKKKIWFKKHIKDQYVKKSYNNNLRSRAWFKLDEINRLYNLLNNKKSIIDLGSSPGGWAKYLATKIENIEKIISCDILPMKKINKVEFIQGNFLNIKIQKNIINLLNNKKVQVIISDMLPNISGISEIDIPNSMRLIESILNICLKILKKKGNLLIKIFQCYELNNFLIKLNFLFNKVKIFKPKSSYSHSREIYIVAIGFKL